MPFKKNLHNGFFDYEAAWVLSADIKANDKTTTVFTRQDYMQNLEINAMDLGWKEISKQFTKSTK